MKLRLSLFAAVIAAILSFATDAKAAIITSDLGTLGYGASGTATYDFGKGDPISIAYEGALLAEQTIKFTITYHANISDLTSTFTHASYDYIGADGHEYSGSAMASASVKDGASTPTFEAYKDGTTSQQLVFASANMDKSTKSGAATIVNYSAGLVNFGLDILGSFSGQSTGWVTISYNVVPLPAALPLFGLGLAGLVGVKARKRRTAA